MPQEMSSGGMDGWTVHGEKPRRRGEEGGEEEKRAPANSECRLPISLRSPPSVTLKVKMLRRVSRNCPRLCPSRPGCWLPRCRRSARTWRDRSGGWGVGGSNRPVREALTPLSLMRARARVCPSWSHHWHPKELTHVRTSAQILSTPPHRTPFLSRMKSVRNLAIRDRQMRAAVIQM